MQEKNRKILYCQQSIGPNKSISEVSIQSSQKWDVEEEIMEYLDSIKIKRLKPNERKDSYFNRRKSFILKQLHSKNLKSGSTLLKRRGNNGLFNRMRNNPLKVFYKEEEK